MSNPYEEFVAVESPDGWSLHAPGASDEDIREGRAAPLVSGPWIDDERSIPDVGFDYALRALRAA